MKLNRFRANALLLVCEMEITRVLSLEGLSAVTINIDGNVVDPKFRAHQMGTILGLPNLIETISHFESDETGIAFVNFPGQGRWKTWWLSEFGLYRLIGLSDKPFASAFCRLIGGVLREIRQTAIEEANAALAAADRALAGACNALEEADQAIAQRDKALVDFRQEIFSEQISVSEVDTGVYEIGTSMRTESAVFKQMTTNSALVSWVAEFALSEYASGSGRFFKCKLSRIVNIIKVASSVIDVFGSSVLSKDMNSIIDMVKIGLDNLVEL